MHYLIGCGGVGSYLVPILSKMFPKDLTIIDGDIIEEKNLLRQNFLPFDVGMYKAERLAGRYDCMWKATYITDKNINKYIHDEATVFMCVDKNQCRRDVFNMGKDKNLFIINGANEKDRGHSFIYHPAIESNVLQRYDFGTADISRAEDLCNIQYGDINYFVSAMMMWMHRYWKDDIDICIKAWRKGQLLSSQKKQEIITNHKTINLLQ